jgi:hypothetical protein
MSSKLLVNNYLIDLSNDVAVPITFSVADVKQPQSRTRSFSKSIDIPGTSNNLRFFTSAFGLATDGTGNEFTIFNPSLKAPCNYFKDDLLIFSGQLQLTNVKKVNGDYSFSCILYSNIVDYFAELKNKKLSELGWSEYNHTLNADNITKSWDSTIKINGISVRNFDFFNGKSPKAKGYIYPLINYGYPTPLNTNVYKVTDLIPYVYARECLTKIFKFIGLTINNLDTDFINTLDFKRLIYGSSGGEKLRISNAEKLARKLELTNIYEGVKVLPSQYYYYFFVNYVLQGNLLKGTFIPSTNKTTIQNGVITIPATGKYNLNYTTKYKVTSATNLNVNDFSKILIYRNGIIINTAPFGITKTNNEITISFNTDIDCSISDKIELKFLLSLEVTPDNLTVYNLNYDFYDGTLLFTAIDGVITDESIIEVGTLLPDITCSEFLSGIISMFNLYITDAVDSKVSIYTINEYYGKDYKNYLDWTNKVDHSKEIIINSASLIEGKNYQFKWSAEKDYYNDLYLKASKKTFGNFNYEVEDTFKTGDKVWQLPFAQYVPVNMNGLVIPQIYTIDNGVAKTYKGKGLLTFYNGLYIGQVVIRKDAYGGDMIAMGAVLSRTNTPPAGVKDARYLLGASPTGVWSGKAFNIAEYNGSIWVFTSPIFGMIVNVKDENKVYRYTNSWTIFTDIATYANYPVVHHFNFEINDTNFLNPKWDLHFETREVRFDKIDTIPTLNLFNRFHEKNIKEITSKSSKLIEIYIKLTSKEILSIDFKKLIMIEGVLYKLNLISDFDSDAYESTKVELLKFIP